MNFSLKVATFMIIAAKPALGFLPPLSNLQSIISTRAFAQTLFQDLRAEITARDHILFNIVDFDNLSVEYAAASVFILFLYGQYKYNQGAKTCDINTLETSVNPGNSDKLCEFEYYKTAKKIAKELVFIFALIFYKNVENVY
jgi:hypothetical protein